MNNMACGVLTVSGTPQIYCVGGSAAGQTTATGRVFSYNPVTDTPTTLAGDDWPGAMGTILPGGFTVANNKLYILGGFNINVASTNQIWEFDPTARCRGQVDTKDKHAGWDHVCAYLHYQRHHLCRRSIRLPGWHGGGHDHFLQLRSTS